jgi:type IV pilus assembly protein PilA
LYGFAPICQDIEKIFHIIVPPCFGVLVAVSIPIFTAQLEKSRESTDMANLRAAKAAAVSEYLVVDSGDTTVTWPDANDAPKGFTAYYEAKGGLLQATKPTATYGAGTATVGSASNTDFNVSGK